MGWSFFQNAAHQNLHRYNPRFQRYPELERQQSPSSCSRNPSSRPTDPNQLAQHDVAIAETKSLMSFLEERCTLIFYLFLWILWLAVGTVFYGYVPPNNLGTAKGFYMSINIGYSIGWGHATEQQPENVWFSSVYILFGASFVSIALGFFAQHILDHAENWFTRLLQRRQHQENMSANKPITTRIGAFLQYHRDFARSFGLWLVWILSMIALYMLQIGGTLRDAQYFAIGTCSTGGFIHIPDDSPDWMYGVVALLTCIGVPLQATVIASFAPFFFGRHNVERMHEQINADVTMEELQMLQQFGLEDGDGEIDRAEYIILCLVRMGTDPNIIRCIADRFHELDADHGGTLDFHEITRGKYKHLYKADHSPISRSTAPYRAYRASQPPLQAQQKQQQSNVDDITDEISQEAVAKPVPAIDIFAGSQTTELSAPLSSPSSSFDPHLYPEKATPADGRSGSDWLT